MFDSMASFLRPSAFRRWGLVLVHFGWRVNFALTGFSAWSILPRFFAFYRNPSQDAKLTETEREYIRFGGAQPKILSARRKARRSSI